MSENQTEIPLSKKGHREVTPFVGHELLYDYLCDKLDPERKQSVENHIKYSRDAQLDLQKIQSGQQYAQKLSQTVVSESIIEQINKPTTYFSELLEKSQFEKWPVGVKWGLEVLVVVSVIVVLLTISPWEKLMKMSVTSANKEVVLAEVKKEKIATEPIKKEESAETKFADEGAPQAASADPAKSKVPSVTESVAVVNSAQAPVVPAKVAIAEKKVESKQPEVAKTNPVSKVETVQAGNVANKEESAADKHVSGGFLYRGSIAITNVEVVSSKITEKIVEFGGRKAGDVELGWKKSPNSAYYHFTIPEAKYQELQSFLQTYGKVKISKEKHPRIMPDGIIRLIITVDEAKK